MKLKVITDSTCDLPSDYYQKYEIAVVAVNIHFGTETYLDGITIDHQTFYKKIDALGTVPKTSLPSVGQFAEVYREWAKQGYDTILSVHLTSSLSGLLNAARLGAQEVANEVKVIPFDSLSGSAALGFMCVEAVEMARAGKTLEEILARLNQVAPRVRISLTLDTLRFAALSGRISNIQSFVASMLNIKPIVCLREGKLIPEGRSRSRQAAFEQIVRLTQEAAGQSPIKLAVLHAQAPAEAERLLADLKPRVNSLDCFVGNLTTSLAVHFGPGAIGTVVYPVS
ncbi:MAG: DegV family protein [Chloroflexi bacterium]|nr:DegV family protein [Chloroflexota bacterium]